MQAIGPGTKIKNLEVEALLGRGAFARVYLARDLVIGRRIALKLLHAPEQHGDASVLKEARAIGGLNSPHIVTLYGVHRLDDGRWMFEMEYVEGGTLGDRIKRGGALPPEDAARTAHGIALALRTAHDGNVVHGDVKPTNVLIDAEGTVKLADFGLGRLLGDATLTLSDPAGAGTPGYMAPEVIMGDPPGKASDIWSFGVLLYELLAGRRPFTDKNLPRLFHAITHEEPRLIEPPSPLARLVRDCMAKAPADRPAGFGEILERLAGDAGAVRPAPPAAAEPLPLIGRDVEWARLSTLLDRAAAGSGDTVVVTGEAGVGKSALVAELRRSAANRGFLCCEAVVTPLRGLLRPLLESVRDALGSGTASRGSRSASTALEELLAESESLKVESRSRTLWALEQLITAFVRELPLLLVLEDTENADEEDVHAIEHFVKRLRAHPVVIAVTGRSEPGDDTPVHRLAAQRDVTRIALESLSREETYRHLCALSGARHADPDVARRVYAIGQGNPLYTVELYHHLERAGALRVADDQLLPGRAWTTVSFPRRFTELCAVRLKGVEEDVRALLDVAAVDGIHIDGEAIAAVLGEPVIPVLRRIQRTYRQLGFVVPDAAGFRFKSALFQEHIYGKLGPELRRQYHLALAAHLRSREDAEPIDPERIGTHLERGGDRAAARPYLWRAVFSAAKRQEHRRAIDLARRSRLDVDVMTDAAVAQWAKELIPLAFCYRSAGQPDVGQTILDRVGDAVADDAHMRAIVFVHKAINRFYRTGLDDADEQELQEAVRTLEDRVLRGKALYLLGTVAKFRGDLDEAEKNLTECRRIFANRLPSWHASTLDQLGSVALRRGQLGEAEEYYHEAAVNSSRAGRRTNAATSRINAALTAIRRGRLEGVEDTLVSAIAELDLEGSAMLSAHAATHLARLRYSLGDVRSAAETIRDAVQRVEDGQYHPGIAAARWTQAHLVALQGDLDLAERHLARADDAARSADALQSLASNGGLRALILAWRGRHAEAAAELARVLRDVEATPAVIPDIALYAAKCSVFGTTEIDLDAVEARLDDSSEIPTAVARAFIRAARALRSDGGPAALTEAARVLQESDIGEERTALRAFGAYFEAEAQRRSGNTDAAEESAARARAAASQLGHVWLQRLLD